MKEETRIVVSDMDYGSTYCNNCDENLDKGDPLNNPIPNYCPNCKEHLHGSMRSLIEDINKKEKELDDLYTILHKNIIKVL